MAIKFNASKYTVLAEGGEGVIYDYNDREVAKIYKSHIDLRSKEKKINALMKKSLPKSIIAPTEIVVDKKGKFIGYIMPKVSGDDFKKLGNKKFISVNKINSKNILDMLIEIKDTLDKLHSMDIYIGDLNDQNILFDQVFNIFFIDCDSWTIDKYHCTVAMDLFKDPLLQGDNFNKDTDTYSFSILAWKSLTRIHPFGGTMNPDIDILERMAKGISVIDNPKVKIPRTIKSWKYLSPNLISQFKTIFENKSRSFNNEFEDLQQNFVLCPDHKDHYYSKYNKCPICDAAAKILIKPISQGVMKGLTLIPLLDAKIIDLIIDQYTYINVNGNIEDRKYGKTIINSSGSSLRGVRYYFTPEANIVDYRSRFIINTSNKEYKFDKRFKTSIVVEEDKIFYIDKKGSLIETVVMKQGNSIKKIADCSNSAYFNVVKGHYCIVNEYDDNIIVNIDGYNTTISYTGGIVNYGIHYDELGDRWLIVLENKSGMFTTMVISKKNIIFSDTRIKYQCHLNNLCLSNSTIFIPIDDAIRGYAYNKDAFKDFECSVVTPDSKLIRQGKSFLIINDENIYNLK